MRALLMKNGVIFLGKPTSLIMYILTPMISLMFLAWITQYSVINDSQFERVHLPARIPHCFEPVSGASFSNCKLAYVNGGNLPDIDAIMARVVSSAGLPLSDLLEFTTAQEAASYAFNNGENLAGIVVFEEGTITTVPAVTDVYYQIWTNSTVTRSTDPQYSPLASFYSLEVSGASLGLQNLVDEAILNVWDGGSVDDPFAFDLSFQRLPSTETIGATNLDLRKYPLFSPMFITAGTMASFLVVINIVLTEKEQQLLGVLRQAGLYESAFWMSWTLFMAVPAFLASLPFVVYGRWWSQFYLLEEVPIYLWMLVLTVFGMAMGSLGLCVGSVSSKPKWGNGMGFCLIAIAVIWQMVFLIASFNGNDRLNGNWEGLQGPFTSSQIGPMTKLVIKEHFPFFNLAKFLGDVTSDILPTATRNATEFTWDDFTKDRNATAPTYVSVLWMAENAVFYYVGAWYWAQALSGINGASLGLLFFLSPYYWKLQKRVPPQAERGDRVAHEKQLSGSRSSIRSFKLSKTFDSVQALKEVTLEVNTGQITALLGHNGAGKSTLINILTGVHEPTHGHAFIHGLSIREDMEEIRDLIGVCSQHDVIWSDLTARQHLTLIGRFRGLHHPFLGQQVQSVLEHMQLVDAADRKAGGFSGGMKRRLAVGMAVMGDPKVIFMDEPTSGTDALNRRRVWEMIQPMKEGRIVVLTTHSMEEADVLGDEISILSTGGLRASGSSLFLKDRYGSGYQLNLLCDPPRVDELKQLVTSLLPQTEFLDSSAGAITCSVPRVQRTLIPRLLQGLEAKPDLVKEWGVSNTTLEEVFLRLAAGHGLNEVDVDFSDNKAATATIMCAICGERHAVICAKDARDHKPLPAYLLNQLKEEEEEEGELTALIAPMAAVSSDAQALHDAAVKAQQEEDERRRLEEEGWAEEAFIPAVDYNMKAPVQAGAVVRVRAKTRAKNRKGTVCQLITMLIIVLFAFLLEYLMGIGSGGAECADPTFAPSYCNEDTWVQHLLTGSDPRNSGPGFFREPVYCNVTDISTGEEVFDLSALWYTTGYGYERTAVINMTAWVAGPDPTAALSLMNSVQPYFHDRDAAQNFVPLFQSLGWTTDPRFTSLDALQTIFRTEYLEAYGRSNPPESADVFEAIAALQTRGYPTGILAFDSLNPAAHQVSFTVLGYFGAYEIYPQAVFTYPDMFFPDPRFPSTVFPDGQLTASGDTRKVGAILGSVHSAALSSRLGTEKNLFAGHKFYPPTDSANLGTDFFRLFVLNLTTILYTVSLTLLLPSLIADVVQDRASGVMHSMETMGMRLVTYYVANWVNMMAVQMVLSGLFYLAGYALELQVFFKVSPVVFAALLLAWSHAQAGCAFLLASLIKTSRQAYMVGYSIVFVNAIVATIMNQAGGGKVSWWFYLFPPFTFVRGLFTLGGGGSSLTDALTPVGWLVGVGSAYLVLGPYLTLVRPGGGSGMQKHPLFPLFFLWHLVSGQTQTKLAATAAAAVSTTPSAPPQAEDPYNVEMPTKGGEESIYAVPSSSSYPRPTPGRRDSDVVDHEQAVRSSYSAGRSTEDFPITILDLYKQFGQEKIAVDGVTLGVRKNMTLGLLGPNGAGKTTIISMLTGLISPSSGIALVSGNNIITHMHSVHQLMGVSTQFDTLYEDLSVAEHLRLYARIKGANPAKLQALVQALAESVELAGDAFNQPAAQLSGGMKRRLSLGCALAGNPSILLLDEPSTGLDPQSKKVMWRIINRAKQNRVVILTTHSMEEADALCGHIAIMARGKLKAIGQPAHLKAKFGAGYKMTAVLKKDPLLDAKEARVRDFVGKLLPQAKLTRSFGGALTFAFPREGVILSNVFKEMEKVRKVLEIENWGLVQSTLEDAFVSVVEADEQEAISGGSSTGAESMV